jgi:hypothetical protein
VVARERSASTSTCDSPTPGDDAEEPPQPQPQSRIDTGPVRLVFATPGGKLSVFTTALASAK